MLILALYLAGIQPSTFSKNPTPASTSDISTSQGTSVPSLSNSISTATSLSSTSVSATSISTTSPSTTSLSTTTSTAPLSTSTSTSSISTTANSTSSTSTTSISTTATASEGGVTFSSIVYPFTYGTNFETSGNSFPVEVNATMRVNTIQFYFSDRAYDPNNQTVYFETFSGQVMATGILSLWGPYGKSGDEASPVPLNSVIILQPSTLYKIAFSSLPSTDKYSGSSGVGVDQALITEAAPASGGYLGQSQWPVFALGFMTVLPTTSGLAVHNYGSFTDLYSSAGYGGTTENAIRFLANSNELLISFQVEAITSDGSNNLLVFTLRSDSEEGGSHPVGLSTVPPLATASVTAAQVSANLTANTGSETTGQSTFIKVSFTSEPLLTAGHYYWIVIASPSGNKIVTFARLVNPYMALVYNSENDFQTWGPPADGPTDLSFVVTTTDQTINNAVSGTPKNNAFSIIAQALDPTKSTLVNGVWTEANPGGFEMTVSVQTDSGDSPSGTILAQGNISASHTFAGLQGASIFVKFSTTPVLSAGTKYWLVYQVGRCLESSCSSPDNAYVVEYAEVLPALHVSVYSGSGWNTEPGQMNFVFTSPVGAASLGLFLDSSASVGCNACIEQSLYLRVTADDLVVVQVELSPESVYSRSAGASYHAGFLSSLSSPGMMFQERFYYTTNPGSGDGSMVWEEYAISPATTTIAITGAVNNSLTAWSMIGYSVTGADTSMPFDNNSRLATGAYEFNDCNQTDGCRVGFSTTSADTMVIFGIASEGNPEMLAPKGFALIQSVTAPGWGANGVAYQLLSSPQKFASTGNWGMTGLTCTQNASNSCGESALWYADAIVAAPSSSTSSPGPASSAYNTPFGEPTQWGTSSTGTIVALGATATPSAPPFNTMSGTRFSGRLERAVCELTCDPGLRYL